MLVELKSPSLDNNTSAFHLQHQDPLGNSEATGFGSLTCQVTLRSGAPDSPAVYLKKGRLAMAWGLSGLTGVGFRAASSWAILGRGPHCPQPEGWGGSFYRPGTVAEPSTPRGCR